MIDEPNSSVPAVAPPAPLLSDATVLAEARRRSHRSFIGLGLAGMAGLVGWNWLISRPDAAGFPHPLRKVLDTNGRLSSAYFKETRLASNSPAAAPNPPAKTTTSASTTKWTLMPGACACKTTVPIKSRNSPCPT